MKVSVVGIDPGKHGAVALLSNDPETCLFWLLSEIDDRKTIGFEDILRVHDVKHIYIEKAQVMPQNGAVSMFNYGTGFGKILGWCEMINIPFTLVPPRIWTKEMHKGCTGPDAKTKSLMAVKRLFPNENLKSQGATSRSTKLHDGLVDALLIAEYGRRIFR